MNQEVKTPEQKKPAYSEVQGFLSDLLNTDYSVNESIRKMVRDLDELSKSQLLSSAQKEELSTYVTPFYGLTTFFDQQQEVKPAQLDEEETLGTVFKAISSPRFKEALTSITACTIDVTEMENFLRGLLPKLKDTQYEAKVQEVVRIHMIKPTQYLAKLPLILNDISKKKVNTKWEPTINQLKTRVKKDIKELDRKYDKRHGLDDLVIDSTGGISLADILFENGIVLGAKATTKNIRKAKFAYRRAFFGGNLFKVRRNQILQKFLGLNPNDTSKINAAIQEAKKAEKQKRSSTQLLTKKMPPLPTKRPRAASDPGPRKWKEQRPQLSNYDGVSITKALLETYNNTMNALDNILVTGKSGFQTHYKSAIMNESELQHFINACPPDLKKDLQASIGLPIKKIVLSLASKASEVEASNTPRSTLAEIRSDIQKSFNHCLSNIEARDDKTGYMKKPTAKTTSPEIVANKVTAPEA